jgi:ribonucleoside-diphosphate reductase alpha chain
MTGTAYKRSAELAGVVGPYDGYARNADATSASCASTPRPTTRSARCPPRRRRAQARDEGVGGGQQARREERLAQRAGLVLAPTGTIGFMMDCDTTGIEPDFSLVKFKKLVGGGSMQIVNQTIPRALRKLGYTEETVEAIVEYIAEHGHVVDAPGLKTEHYEVFDCAMGERAITPDGPRADDGGGAAVPLRGDLQDGEHAGDGDGRGGRGDLLPGLEDGHQGAGDLPRQLQGRPAAVGRQGLEEGGRRTRRPRPIPRSWSSTARPQAPAEEAPEPDDSFSVGGAEGYMTAGSYPDDGLGEVFLKLGKQGSTLAGVMDAFSIAISIGLQYGVPLEAYVSKFTNMRFEPAGMTDDPDVRMAQSIMDYIFRRLALDYLPYEKRAALGIFTAEERARAVDRLVRRRPRSSRLPSRRG